MNINHLKYFVMAVDLGSYSAAARAAGVTQPTISSAIKSLEKEFGSVLLLPNNEGLELTDAGERLLGNARTLLGDAALIGDDMQRAKDLESGAISIGVRDHLLTSTLRKLLDGFTDQNPQVDVRIVSGGYYQLLQQLQGAKLDFIIDHSRREASPDNLESQLLMHDPLMFFMRPGHPESDKQELPIETFSQYPGLYPRTLFQENSLMGGKVERNSFMGLRPAIDIDDVNLMGNIVAESSKDYLFVWSYQLFETWVQQGKLVGVPVAGDGWYLPIRVSYRSKHLLSEAANNFVAELQQEVRQQAKDDSNPGRVGTQAAAAAEDAN